MIRDEMVKSTPDPRLLHAAHMEDEMVAVAAEAAAGGT